MTRESLVSKSVRQGIVFAAISPFVLISPSNAVAAVDSNVERIEVTGSRISRVDIEAASPVEVLDRSFIENSGVSNIADLLKQVPANQSIQDTRNTTGFAGAASGVDLNGLGVGSTLTLLNGRRMAPQGRPTMTGTAEMFVNIDSIPLAAVERVEILRDGASAIYGSDAIAGVVNIILRKDYEGVEISTRGGVAVDGSDMHEIENSIFAGVSNDKTSMTMMVSQYKRNEVSGADLGLSANNGYMDFSSSATPAGTVWDRELGQKDGYAATSDRCDQESTDGTCRYDYAPISTLMPEVERWGLMANVSHELNENHTIKAETLITTSNSNYQLAAAPWFAGNDNIEIDPNNPVYDQIAGGDGIYDNGKPLPTDGLTFSRRFDEVGPRLTNEESTSYRVLIGADGYLSDTWEYSTAVTFNKSYTVNRSDNHVSASRALNALQNGVDFNGDGVLQDSEWFNPLAEISDEMADYLRATTFQESTYETWTADLSVTNSELFEAWAGYVGMAAGVEYREEKLQDIASDNSKNLDIVGSGGSDANGKRDQFSAYVEFAVPLMDNDAGYWDMQVAGRFEDYSDFGTKMTPKVATSYAPTDGVMFRASYSEGFRAPNLYELDGQSVGFQRFVDTTMCPEPTADNPHCEAKQYRVVSGGNQNLQPETSTSYNVGAVLDMDALGLVDGLSLTVDYFKIEHEDRIEKLSASDILEMEQSGQPLPDGTEVIRAPDGTLQELRTYSTNLSSRVVDGYNASINYAMGLGALGELTLVNSTYYLANYEVSGLGEQAGTWLQPRLRNTAQFGWEYGDYSSSLSVIYRGTYDDLYGQHYNLKEEVSSMTTFNLRVSYQGIEDMTLTFGIDNLFDKERPIDASNDLGGISDLDTLYGRFVYAQAKFIL